MFGNANPNIDGRGAFINYGRNAANNAYQFTKHFTDRGLPAPVPNSIKYIGGQSTRYQDLNGYTRETFFPSDTNHSGSLDKTEFNNLLKFPNYGGNFIDVPPSGAPGYNTDAAKESFRNKAFGDLDQNKDSQINPQEGSAWVIFQDAPVKWTNMWQDDQRGYSIPHANVDSNGTITRQDRFNATSSLIRYPHQTASVLEFINKKLDLAHHQNDV